MMQILMKNVVLLTIKTEVLSEGLAAQEFEASRDEVSNCPGILLQVSRGKPLVRRVEQREQLPLLEHIQQARHVLKIRNHQRHFQSPYL